MTTRTAITGNTYPHRDALRAMGGVWDAAQKAWMVPADRADEARALVTAVGYRDCTTPLGRQRRRERRFRRPVDPYARYDY